MRLHCHCHPLVPFLPGISKLDCHFLAESFLSLTVVPFFRLKSIKRNTFLTFFLSLPPFLRWILRRIQCFLAVFWDVFFLSFLCFFFRLFSRLSYNILHFLVEYVPLGGRDICLLRVNVFCSLKLLILLLKGWAIMLSECSQTCND